jgi:predicted nucleic acid-binding protein
MDDDGPSLALGTIWDMAERYALTVYDATYVELALRRSLPLASRDKALNHAARLAGAKTLL